ncbi:RsmD family RNA methyltransferase [Thermotoga sp. KOL6]|uniref:RsmD family RNA methyltransferase n=1 Tax=Thermotoga sp. KOL6 TaxID=126741 RepID=UPI001E3929B1|nr:RsmD family RNA methyltransferase [Thermotoga sp. KOL6]
MKTGDFFRPTMASVRSALFNMIDVSGKSFLELFCGSCVVSCEALSRGAKEVVCVDKSKRALKICKKNLETIGKNAEVVHEDAIVFLKRHDKKFDIVFFDPPYEEIGTVKEVLRLLPKVMKENSLAILEKSKRVTINFEGYEIVKIRDYGETELVFLKVKKCC